MYSCGRTVMVFTALLQLMLWHYAVAKVQLVYPTILQERSTAGNLVVKLDERITLNLQRSTILADNILFVTSSKDLHEVETVDTSDIQESIYHDTHYQSSVVVRQKEGNVEVEGIINDNMRIRPLPEGERSMQGQMLHKIYEVEPIEANFVKAEPEMLRLTQANNHKNSSDLRDDLHSPQARASGVEKFPVELHVISDRAHQKYYKTNKELITYVAVMSNAVQLRYLDMTNPKMTFLLVGVTRAKDHSFAKNNGGEIEAGEMLGGLQNYKEKGKVPGKPDLVYLITGLDMVKIDKGQRNKGVAGLAYIGAVCTPLGLGEGEDTAHTYDGVTTMAHELAHTLGSPHDETPECPWSQGYLMSYVDGGLRKYRLSPCSENTIRKCVKKQSAACIKVVSSQNFLKVHRRFPGQTVRAQYFCKRLLRDKANGKKITMQKHPNCEIWCCQQSFGYKTCFKYKMLDGMACGRGGQTCRRGVCANHDY